MGRFALFQTVSSYTNTGMSLVDQSMIPFQTAYLMIFVMAFLILAGNTAFVSALPPGLFVLSDSFYSQFCKLQGLVYLVRVTDVTIAT